jgi:NAD(P)H dehydrogenase (quinone)
MMVGKITLTGATGQLGNLVVRHLLEKGVPAQNMAAVVRNVEKAGQLKELGLEIRQGDYEDGRSLLAAFKDTEKLLFISSPLWDNTHRIKQHATVVEAARDAGVGHIVYTSLAFPDKMTLGLEHVHLATEHAIKTTGIPYTFLRNGFYMELLVNPSLQGMIQSGEIVTSTAGGKMNYVTRSNLALAAATVLTEAGHENQIYELVNPNVFTYDQLAAILSEVSGKEVKHRDVSPDEAYRLLVQSGASEGDAGFLVHGLYASIAKGQFSHTSDDLHKLIGDHITTVQEAVQQELSK